MTEALLYKKTDKKSVSCFLCNQNCKIAEGKFGFCGVRQNKGGVLYSLVYGQPVATQVDPVEKKPLYHFLPGSSSFSLATIGCNFRCGFCQNWEISQAGMQKEALLASRSPRRGGLNLPYGGSGGASPVGQVSPGEIVAAALKNNCQSISYTYSEPTIFFEYALDIAKLAKEKSLKNIFVTNGYMTKEALEMLRPYLDAANVDLKFFKDSSYKKVCSASLEPVLNSIRLMKEMGIWVEVTTLVVPGENDSDEELQGIAEFIAGVDKSMPWHVSGFHPDYKFIDYQPTPVAALKKAMQIGHAAGLTYIYAGNVAGLASDTYCHSCKKLLIKRQGFSIIENNIRQSSCAYCKEVIPGEYAKD
ncbi:MAG: AmmeMemoRadiSam system radical SAM enzyme [Candidatus Omnitrophota bacterium]